MADPRGFLAHGREGPARRPVTLRTRDWREVYEPFPPERVREQAARCMDCGIPFCHEGCPLGNLIPDWNDLVFRGRFEEASESLHATNNFPEFTGRLCPAPCEGSCVLGIDAEPVAIKQVEVEIAAWAAASGRLTPRPPAGSTGKRVAVVGSGPAGLAAAQQLTRAGHTVVVFERAEAAGGLLRFGIPEFKMEKAVLERRLRQMTDEGTEFVNRVSIGAGLAEVVGATAPEARVIRAADLRASLDAVVLACGSTRPRDLPVRGRGLAGVHFAMEYLKPANLVCAGELAATPIDAHGRDVVIIGGGDTGADCLGTVHRQGAASVRQLEILARPPDRREADNPWPTWPLIFRTSSAHEEGGMRVFSVETDELVDDGTGSVRALRGHEVESAVVDGRPAFRNVPGTEFEIPAQLVLLAMGFTGPEQTGVVAELGVALDGRGNVVCDGSFMTSVEGVFACGDMARGQSLIVWAIAEGRSAAAAVDEFLMGRSDLPAPLRPGQAALR